MTFTTDVSRRSLEYRQERAEARWRVANCSAQLADGMRELADVLDERRVPVERMLLWRVLDWVPRMNPKRRRRLMSACEVYSDYRRVEDLTDRQRGLLAAALRGEES